MVVGQPGELRLRLPARKHGHRLPVTAQEGRDPGIARTEAAVGIVAARGDHGLRRRGPVAERDGYGGVDLPEQSDDVFHEHGILRRRLHQTAVSGNHDAQQVEKTDQRDIPGHHHQHVERPGRGQGGVGGQPALQFRPLQHVPAQGPHRTADLRRA